MSFINQINICCKNIWSQKTKKFCCFFVKGFTNIFYTSHNKSRKNSLSYLCFSAGFSNSPKTNLLKLVNISAFGGPNVCVGHERTTKCFCLRQVISVGGVCGKGSPRLPHERITLILLPHLCS